MRRTKIVSFTLAACMGVSLLVNVPVGTASAAEPEEVVTAEVSATETDAEALDEAQEVVYDESKADEDGFVWDGTKLVKYVGKGGDVKIPEGCTSIGDSAFFGCSGLTSVEIPTSVTSIGDWAFYGCSGLTSIEIPTSVTSIGDVAFYGCSGLTSIEIPTSVTSIGDSAFYGCSGLTSIVVSTENQKYNSEGNCNAIIETETNTLVQGCKNTKIPTSVTSIGDSAFSRCSGLTSIEIPTSVTSIGNSAFYGCSGLTSIEIPSSVTSIGDQAFNGCSGLTSIEIPSSVASIGNFVFYGCSGLTSIVVSTENQKYNSEGNCNAIIETETNTLIQGCKNTKIPTSVASIEDSAFFGCSGLTSIEIPSSVTSIGDQAFNGCRGLTSIEIPSSVTSIGDQAFYGCRGLTSIEIPTSVMSIGSCAFYGCSGLTSIVVSTENQKYNSEGNCNAIIETETNTLIQGCKNTKIPKGVTSIGACAFYGCSGLTSIEIPSSVTSIGNSAFYGCRGLTSIEIPSSVTSIDVEVFLYSNLKTIYGTSGTCAETYAKENGYQFVERVTVPTVTNVKAAAAGKNKVKVTWDKVSGATGYIVYARKNGKYAKIDVTAATNYTDSKALDNDYNFYFVYAYKKTAAGNIFTGKCQKYAYAKGTCMAVTNLKASSVKGGVKLTWTKSAGADGYIVYGKKTNFKYGYVGMTTKNTATSYTDTKANKGSYNFYWVFPYHYDKSGKRVIGPICGYVYGKAK